MKTTIQRIREHDLKKDFVLSLACYSGASYAPKSIPAMSSRFISFDENSADDNVLTDLTVRDVRNHRTGDKTFMTSSGNYKFWLTTKLDDK